MTPVTVVTDSAAALPADLVERHGIKVVPLWLTIGDERHRDGDIALDEVVRRFAEPITTSAPSPGEFAAVIAPACAEGPVLVLTVAARMSSTHDSATLAAKLVAEDGLGGRLGDEHAVAVIDTATAAGAQALVVLAAAEAAAAGAD
ncbi:MAG TPA: DegV family protein, partial [Acidimicrobiales bacterium]